MHLPLLVLNNNELRVIIMGVQHAELYLFSDSTVDRNLNGTIEQPKRYFKGRLRMKYGIYPYSDVVDFSARTQEALVGLIGSLRPVEGSGAPIETLSRSYASLAVRITHNLASELDLSPVIDAFRSAQDTHSMPDAPEQDLGFIVGDAFRLVAGPFANVEFVALQLDVGSFEDRKTLLGTPFLCRKC